MFPPGAASQQRKLTLPNTWSCPIGDLCVVMLRPVSSERVMLPDLNFEHPSFVATLNVKTTLNVKKFTLRVND